MHNIDFNKIITTYDKDITNINQKYNYNNNISHLLYIIIPLFIQKYSLNKAKTIINTFLNIPISINDTKNKQNQAFYASIPKYYNNKIITNKYIILKNFNNIPLGQLVINLIHEYNHALNSYNNEIYTKDNHIYIRTGISYIKYDQNLNPIEKDKRYILEEILNTNQTENILTQINDINLDTISNPNIKNTIYALKNELNTSNNSYGYFLQIHICKYLINNKTFTSTLNTLRFNGNINNLDSWFDNITTINNSFNNLISYLETIFELEKKLTTKKFKYIIINKIRKYNSLICSIIETFNKNCTYK